MNYITNKLSKLPGLQSVGKGSHSHKNKYGKSGSYKMLLLGQTGSGKTTLLNLFGNMGVLQQMKQDPDAQRRLKNYHRVEFENARDNAMVSKTSEATVYDISYQIDASSENFQGTTEPFKVTVIDTPGFGDTRGRDRDLENMGRIQKVLNEVDYINCICLVVNGKEPKMNATLRYVLSELTSMMPKEVLDCIIVVLTNATNILQLNFDIRSLTEYFGRDLKQYYVIDNPVAIINKAQQMRGHMPEAQVQMAVDACLDNCMKQMDTMFQDIAEFPEYYTNSFQKLYTVKQRIEAAILNAVMSLDCALENIKEVNRVRAKLRASSSTMDNNKVYESTLQKIVQKATDSHNTLCGFPQCQSNCHAPCSLPKSLDKEAFKWCASISDGICTVCGHSYEYHYHLEQVFEKVTESTIDPHMKAVYDKAKTEKAKMEGLEGILATKQRDLDNEKKQLSQDLARYLAEFEKLAINRSYRKLLLSQKVMLESYITACDIEEDKKHFAKGLEEVEKQLKVLPGPARIL